MNIYFACSITGGREFQPIYRSITIALMAAGHLVPTAHLAGEDIQVLEAKVEPAEVYARDTAWIRNCNALVAEVSTPSHGVGYEIGFALGLGKPVLCLYRKGRVVSKMITGNPDPLLHQCAYKDEVEALVCLNEFLNFCKTL